MLTKSIYDLPYLSKSKPDTSPLISAWANQVVTNGGTRPTAPTIALRDSVNRSIIAAGIDSKVLTWNLFATEDSVDIAALTPQKPGPSSVFWTPHGTAAGAIDGNNGIAFSGNPNYIDTGFVPSTAYPDNASAGFILYKYTPFTDVAEADGGCTNSFANIFLLAFSQSGSSFFEYPSFSGAISAANASWTGWLSGQRTALNAGALYKANSGVAHVSIGTNTATDNTARPSIPAFIGNLNNSGTPNNISDGGFSFAAFTLGLTSSEDSALFSIIQSALVSKGGGFV